MPREYDFGDAGKVVMTSRTGEHSDMFKALESLGEMGFEIAKYINDLKALASRMEATIIRLKEEAETTENAEEIQAEVHQRQFPSARPGANLIRKPKKAWVFSDSHTPGPWRMTASGMIRVGEHWICSVSGRNRIYNGPLIEAAPDMLIMLERMLSGTSPEEARTIIAGANALVERAKAPAWERSQREA